MAKPLVLLSIPALREKDVAAMPKLRSLMAGGEIVEMTPGVPCVTCTVQANMTTGQLPDQHGVVANGFYWRDHHRVEMWTAPNDCIERPQIWDLLSHHGRGLTSAVWFPLHSKGCEADYICTPAPLHNPDGTESLWCYTRPMELYGTLRDTLGHFPLMNYWGPMTSVKATEWIVQSAILAARQWQPDFFYIYVPHLDYAAQRSGPDSEPATQAIAELDAVVGTLADGLRQAYDDELLWMAAGEYAMTAVQHVSYPNRVLREAGLLAIQEVDGAEHVNFEQSKAFALVDHQIAHVFTADSDEANVQKIAALFRGQPGIAEVLVGAQRARYHLDHPRSGELILISAPDSWQAYYWWLDDARAPRFARTVDIHQKPGYDPMELFWDPATKGIPLDASRVCGSHGAPATDPSQKTVILASEPMHFAGEQVTDTDVFPAVLNHFGLRA